MALLDAVSNECKKRVPAETDEKSLFPNLLRIRNDALKKVFPGNIILIPYSQEDIINNASDIEYYIKFASIDLIKRYGELISLAAQDTVIKQVEFYKLGFDFLTINPSECPFCGQTINNTIAEHINQKHQEAIDHIELSRKLINQRREVEYALSELTKRLEKSHQRHLPRLNTFLSINDSFDKLTQILLPKYEPYVNSIREAVVQLQEVKTQLNQCVIAASASLKALQLSIQQSKEDVNLMTELGKNLIAYAGILSSSTTIISKLNAPMSDASEILKHELDTVAGTEDISLLIELNEKQDQMKKGFEIESILEGLKELRKTVDQYVGSKMLDAVSNEMTTDVLDWYNQIRTSGDPDVHFTGFDMDRTTKGEIKSRRVQIKASSYGKELVSAVSSLSESKLNALGLCLSIATNLKPGCPFDFLFIDDPIQSWDEEHGEQFIEVVRKLIAKQKQIIILSHNAKWIAQVRTGCSSLNGFYYEITSYNKNGPNIIQKPWCSWRQRVAEIDNILKDPDADKIRLQHAEGEIRLVISELTSDLYFKKKNMHKDANKLNAGDVRKCLFECGLPLTLIDQIEQTFVTTDDAHHVPSYAPQPERIKRYLNYVHELTKN